MKTKIERYVTLMKGFEGDVSFSLESMTEGIDQILDRPITSVAEMLEFLSIFSSALIAHGVDSITVGATLLDGEAEIKLVAQQLVQQVEHDRKQYLIYLVFLPLFLKNLTNNYALLSRVVWERFGITMFEYFPHGLVINPAPFRQFLKIAGVKDVEELSESLLAASKSITIKLGEVVVDETSIDEVSQLLLSETQTHFSE